MVTFECQMFECHSHLLTSLIVRTVVVITCKNDGFWRHKFYRVLFCCCSVVSFFTSMQIIGTEQTTVSVSWSTSVHSCLSTCDCSLWSLNTSVHSSVVQWLEQQIYHLNFVHSTLPQFTQVCKLKSACI
ncbi:hypothetical protein NP493_140g03080 [Ridgeia piscesae]|uniref:Uncharacterized protein n=1 Tax=Ridgeia piscesae TaxID=27915 RepID=A0AAD9P4W2_RIDPI|nr:hypothetical protein NP493_140g03080 [Ridgeia piscesae]